MEEFWKDIKGFEGLYAVSSLGRVKSLKYGKERVLKAGKNKYGYLYVILYKDGIRNIFYIHRLVAEAFLPKVEGKEFIDHINTIRDDNRAENIRYCNRVENQNNPITKEKMSKAQKGEKNHKAKQVIGVNKETGEEVVFACGAEVQRVLGVNNSHIISCCRGKRKSAGGYMWRFA